MSASYHFPFHVATSSPAPKMFFWYIFRRSSTDDERAIDGVPSSQTVPPYCSVALFSFLIEREAHPQWKFFFPGIGARPPLSTILARVVLFFRPSLPEHCQASKGCFVSIFPVGDVDGVLVPWFCLPPLALPFFVNVHPVPYCLALSLCPFRRGICHAHHSPVRSSGRGLNSPGEARVPGRFSAFLFSSLKSGF